MPLTARAFVLNLALCAMVVRALLPEGWMPAGGAALTICSVEQALSGHKAPAHPADRRAHGVCPFAAAAPLAAASGSVTVTILLAKPVRRLIAKGETAPQAPPRPIHPTRAPPSSEA